MQVPYNHIVNWVKNKSIVIVIEYDYRSHFDHDMPDTIFISRTSQHGISASILHEYYHARQFKRGKLTAARNADLEYRADIEYRAEAFVIRCFKRLGLVYDRTFVDTNWYDYRYKNNPNDYYTAAYNLLVDNKILDTLT